MSFHKRLDRRSNVVSDRRNWIDQVPGSMGMFFLGQPKRWSPCGVITTGGCFGRRTRRNILFFVVVVVGVVGLALFTGTLTTVPAGQVATVLAADIGGAAVLATVARAGTLSALVLASTAATRTIAFGFSSNL